MAVTRAKADAKVRDLLAAANGDIRLTDDIRAAFSYSIKVKAVQLPKKLISSFCARFKK